MAEKSSLALLPGLLTDSALWDAQIAALSDVADCVVPEFRTQDSVEAMAEAVLGSMPERFALAGLSMGGYVALAVMAAAPERVERLALLDTNARPDADAQKQRRRDFIALAERGQFKGVTPMLLPMLVHPSRVEDPAVSRTVFAMAERVGKSAFIKQQTAIMGRPDRRALLPEIGCPTLVACGRQDQLSPLELHQEMADVIPHARLEVIEDCGHLAPLERPAETSALLREWLTWT